MERQQEELLGRRGLSRATVGSRCGRAGGLGLGLVVGVLLLGFTLLRVLELAPVHGPRGTAAEPPAGSTASGPAWEGQIEVEARTLHARLEPFHAEGVLERHRSQALGERFDLGPGVAWRLLLWLAPRSAADAALALEQGHEQGIEVQGLEVLDRRGLALSPLASPAAGARADPTRTLLSRPPGPLRSDLRRPVFLWGRVPQEDVRLSLRVAGRPAEGVLRPVDPEADAGREPLPRWYAAVAREAPPVRSSAEEPPLQALEPGLPDATDGSAGDGGEVARLRSELARERARRLEREQAFQELGRQLAELALGRPAEVDAAGTVALEPADESAPERETADQAARARAEEIAAALRVLMRLEGVYGLDLLEPGTLQGDAIGPVVFRCLDERGLLTGSLGAQRLRLEGSRAAHTLTLLLEEGFESRGGVRVPFENGQRRVTLAEVDPEPWFERCPELFRASDLARVPDDGLWDLQAVRAGLNRLLALDAGHGWYRLHSLAGVRGAELVDVQLEELEPSGRLVRRFFADRLEIVLEDGLLVLVLRDGAAVRGAEKEPFRDGRFRIVVPGASVAAWRSVALPGLSGPPNSEPDPGRGTEEER